MNDKIKQLLENTDYVHEEIINDQENCSYSRWLNKNVLKSKVIYEPMFDNFNRVTKPLAGTLELSKKFTYDTDYSLLLKENTNVEGMAVRPNCGITIDIDEQDLSEFNRCSIFIYIKATGYQNFYFHFSIGKIVHTASIIPNQWNHIIWEIDEVLSRVKHITITPFLMGCPPEALPDIEIYIGKIVMEKVNPDYILGWDLGERIAYSHVGYFINTEKIAVTQVANNTKFYILNEENNIVYFNDVKYEACKLGGYYILDFTNFNSIGSYKIKIDNRITETFVINENPYLMSEIKSMNFLRFLRCGEEISGVHSACHLHSMTMDENNNEVPNFGGWHDAGDLSQFEICTAEMAHSILDLALKTDDIKLKRRFLEEAKVGIKWLLQTKFKDGSRALAVSYKIWRDNELKNQNKEFYINKSEKGPFEFFCSSAALACASRCYSDDQIFSEWCLRVAIDDFNNAKKWYKEGVHTKRWGTNIDSQVCGHGILAACEIYLSTNNEDFLNVARDYSKIVMACQEQTYLSNNAVRGFFYEDPAHKYVLTYEHRGHEQSPIQGLCKLYEIEPNEDIKKAIDLYSEYVLLTIHETKPYNLIPAHIYIDGKLNKERFTIPAYMCTEEEGINDLYRQMHNGLKITDGIYLRIFPIAVQRRGFHATLLSKTKAISCIAKLTNNEKLRQIVINQLEWIFGKNPFASSTMYGEGYNYHPLYVAFSRQIVGALPVGIMTKEDMDIPYWPTYNNAVFKEIWGHTTGKFLWILADLL